MSAQTEDIATFQNPVGNWEHNGAFSVELTDDADTSIAPGDAEINGTTVAIRRGRVTQVMGGIQFRSPKGPFYWGYRWIKVIRNGKGDLLWVNDHHR